MCPNLAHNITLPAHLLLSNFVQNFNSNIAVTVTSTYHSLVPAFLCYLWHMIFYNCCCYCNVCLFYHSKKVCLFWNVCSFIFMLQTQPIFLKYFRLSSHCSKSNQPLAIRMCPNLTPHKISLSAHLLLSNFVQTFNNNISMTGILLPLQAFCLCSCSIFTFICYIVKGG